MQEKENQLAVYSTPAVSGNRSFINSKNEKKLAVIHEHKTGVTNSLWETIIIYICER